MYTYGRLIDRRLYIEHHGAPRLYIAHHGDPRLYIAHRGGPRHTPVGKQQERPLEDVAEVVQLRAEKRFETYLGLKTHPGMLGQYI